MCHTGLQSLVVARSLYVSQLQQAARKVVSFSPPIQMRTQRKIDRLALLSNAEQNEKERKRRRKKKEENHGVV